MKYPITIALTILTLFCNGQNNDFIGVWVATAEYRVENIAIAEFYDDFESLIPYNEDGEIDSVEWKIQLKADSIKKANWVPEPVPPIIDTNYHLVNQLLEIKENGYADFKELGKPVRSMNWLSTDKQNEIMLDTLTLRLDSTNHLSLVYYEKDSLQRKILFETITQSKIPANAEIGSLLKKYSWEISEPDQESESNSSWFFENDTLTISVLDIDTTTYQTPGNWMVEEFAGHYFLFIKPNYIPFYLHLTDIRNSATSTIETDYYFLEGFPFETLYPKLVNYRLIGSKLPKGKFIARSSKKLIGKWESIDRAFPVDEKHFNQQMLSSFLTYEFRSDGSAIINYGGEVKDDIGTHKVDKSESDVWSVAVDGKTILFDEPYSSWKLAYFRFINSNFIEVSRQMRSLEGNRSENMRFRMKRVDK
ncbi:MAG: hypothetical protein AAFQ94_15545 [Bacteroidota bacterium]